jgi:hypothetical protein
MGNIERYQTPEELLLMESLDPRHFYAAYVFDRAHERESDVVSVIERAQSLGYPVRYWWLSNAMDLQNAPDRLIVCVHHSSRSEDAGMDLYNALRQMEVNWDDLEAAVVEEYSFLGKRVKTLGDLRSPEGIPLFPGASAERKPLDESIALLTITSQDLKDEAQTRLGRDLTGEEFVSLLSEFKKALDLIDWTFYLGEAIRLCQEAGQVGPAAEDPTWDSPVSND